MGPLVLAWKTSSRLGPFITDCYQICKTSYRMLLTHWAQLLRVHVGIDGTGGEAGELEVGGGTLGTVADGGAVALRFLDQRIGIVLSNAGTVSAVAFVAVLFR